MSLNGTDIGLIKAAIKELLTTDRAHPDTFNPIFQDLINNDVTLEALAKQYTDQQIQLVTETGIPKLNSYKYILNATTDNQIDFNIPLSIFNNDTDTIVVIQDRTVLATDDYSVDDFDSDGIFTIRLVEAISPPSSIFLLILKNVPQGPEGSINGGVLAVGTVPIDRLSEDIETPTGAQQKVDNAITNLINGAPGALDTIKELADALGDDANFSTTIVNRLTADEQDVTTHKAEIASKTQLGHVQIGNGINVDANGVISAQSYSSLTSPSAWIG